MSKIHVGYSQAVFVSCVTLDLAETVGNRLRSYSKAVPARGIATCSSFEDVDAAVGLCYTSETLCWMWLIAVLAMD